MATSGICPVVHLSCEVTADISHELRGLSQLRTWHYLFSSPIPAPEATRQHVDYLKIANTQSEYGSRCKRVRLLKQINLEIN